MRLMPFLTTRRWSCGLVLTARAEHLLVESSGLIFLIQVMCGHHIPGVCNHYRSRSIASVFLLENPTGLVYSYYFPDVTGCLGSLISAQTMTGTFLTSLIWLIEYC
jgi:hypothetical protein